MRASVELAKDWRHRPVICAGWRRMMLVADPDITLA